MTSSGIVTHGGSFRASLLVQPKPFNDILNIFQSVNCCDYITFTKSSKSKNFESFTRKQNIILVPRTTAVIYKQYNTKVKCNKNFIHPLYHNDNYDDQNNSYTNR